MPRSLALALLLLPAVGFAQAAPPAVPSDQIHAGLDVLKTGDTAAALKSLLAAEKVSPRIAPNKLEDPDLINLYQGIAFCYLTAGEPAKAKHYADKLAFAKKTNRSILYNTAVVDVQTRNEPRAIATLKRLVAAAPEDEPAVNLLGVAIHRLTASRPPTVPPASAAEKLESDYNAIQSRLELTRPGYRRWGTDWLTDAKYKHLQFGRNMQLDDVRLHEKILHDAQGFLNDQLQRYQSEMAVPVAETANERRARVARQNRIGPMIQADIDKARTRVADAQKDVDAARAKVAQPTWREDFTPAPPDTALVDKP